MMTVVLDTNVFVSSVLGKTLGEIITVWRAGQFTLVVSDEIVKELSAFGSCLAPSSSYLKKSLTTSSAWCSEGLNSSRQVKRWISSMKTRPTTSS
jgi:predicted nucleic acid-binding protein